MNEFNTVWVRALEDVLKNGSIVSPRGQKTKEIMQRSIEVDMRHCVLTVPERKLSYQFMAAEAYWILSGDDKVSGIAPWNKHISQFSDNGVSFFGAYGPKIIKQIPYVVKKLCEDPDTRQAGLTIWRECPPKTKDVPCTIALFFNIRNGELNCNAFMRSSDLWLGLPYDVFNFSMLSYLICAELNAASLEDTFHPLVTPGALYLTAASSHLYEKNFEAAYNCIKNTQNWCDITNGTTPNLCFLDRETLMETLAILRDSKPGSSLRWWES